MQKSPEGSEGASVVVGASVVGGDVVVLVNLSGEGYIDRPVGTTGDLDISGLVASTGVKYDALITPLTIATPQMLWCGCRFEGTGSAPTMMIADNGQHQNYGAWPNGEYVADSNSTTNIGAGFVWNGGGTGWEDPFGGGRTWARFPVHVGLRVAS